jgi:hypothetical protein
MKRISSNKIKTRKIKKNKYTKTIKKHKYTKGGGEKEKKDKIIKENFRNMFMKSFKKLKESIKNDNTQQLNMAIDSFKNGFKSNQIGINTLIPVTNNTIPINKQNNSQTTPIIGFVPLLVIIFDNIDDLITRKVLIKSFIQNKGNINLKSYNKNITALSSAIKLKDIALIKFLLENGADIKVLTDDQKDSLDIIIKEEEVEKITEKTPIKPIIKLELQTELPSESGYDPLSEPAFWKPIFSENEMLSVRQKINEMMNADGNIPIVNREINEIWSVCKINKTIIPTYFTPTKNEPYESFGTYFSDQDIDFSHFNIVLCSALIVFGIISNKMIGQDYKIIFKGGKAIQLVLAGMPETSVYKTEDIDILLLPDSNIPYDEKKVKNLAGHLSYLIRWFLNTPETQYKVSVQAPNPENKKANQFIYKLSYVKVIQKRDYRKQIMIDDFKQFSDIDFKDVPQNIKNYFEKSIEFKFYINELNETILFRCPNIGSLLDEKIYYYAKYSEFKKLLEERKQITENGYEQLNIMDCNRFLDKFKRAILAMNKGLQKQRFIGIMPDELIEKEKLSIMSRLTKLGIIDESLKNTILLSLYSQ